MPVAAQRSTRQLCPHSLDLVHGRSLQSSRYALGIMGWLIAILFVDLPTAGQIRATAAEMKAAVALVALTGCTNPPRPGRPDEGSSAGPPRERRRDASGR